MSFANLTSIGVIGVIGIAAAASSMSFSHSSPGQEPPAAPEVPDVATGEQPENRPGDEWKSRSMYTIESKTLEGKPAKLAEHDGKVALIVNLASACGYTPQYEGLEKLYNEFKDQGFVVLGFPCNDFGGQEPGTPEEIREFCTSKYHVTFPLFEKVSVKPGESQHVVYKALEAKTGSLPRWNFGKYLVSRDGMTAQFFDTKVTPESKELRDAITKALAAR